MSCFQKNSIKHESLTTKSILLDNAGTPKYNAGTIKISDPLTSEKLTNYDTVFNNRSEKNLYLSPE
jgi:hypothetical protein